MDWLLWWSSYGIILKHNIVSRTIARFINEGQPLVFIGALLCLTREYFQALSRKGRAEIARRFNAIVNVLTVSLVIIIGLLLFGATSNKLVADLSTCIIGLLGNFSESIVSFFRDMYFIFLDKPYKPKDEVEFGDGRYRVLAINLRHTTLVKTEGNGEIGDAVINIAEGDQGENCTKQSLEHSQEINIVKVRNSVLRQKRISVFASQEVMYPDSPVTETTSPT